MNTKYGKLTNGQIEYAPDVLTVDGALKVNPSETSYLAAGWKKVVDDPPAAESGKDVKVSSWTETETTITCVYKQVAHTQQEVAVGESTDGGTAATGGGTANGGTGTQTSKVKGQRTFSKLKLVAALKDADKWVLVKSWLEEKAYYDYYLAAQDFNESYPLFKEGLAALKNYARLTDDEIEAILSKCVV